MGIACSAVGGLVIGFAFYVVILLSVDTELLRSSPNQWPLLLIGLFGGFFGSLFDSFLGAIFQYSGIFRIVWMIMDLLTKRKKKQKKT